MHKIEEKSKGNQVIANLVIGSKSGIVDNISMIPRANEDCFWVIDVCQMRTTQKLINKLKFPWIRVKIFKFSICIQVFAQRF